jgi:hypothetical protein
MRKPTVATVGVFALGVALAFLVYAAIFRITDGISIGLLFGGGLAVAILIGSLNKRMTAGAIGFAAASLFQLAYFGLLFGSLGAIL